MFRSTFIPEVFSFSVLPFGFPLFQGYGLLVIVTPPLSPSQTQAPLLRHHAEPSKTSLVDFVVPANQNK